MVPLRIHWVVFDVELIHLVIRDFLAGIVLLFVPFRFHSKTLFRAGRSNPVDDCFLAHQGFPFPIQTEERKESMLDLLPLAGSRRIVAHAHPDPQWIRKPLQIVLPGPAPAGVAASTIRTQ